MPEFYEVSPEDFDEAAHDAAFFAAVMKHAGHMITVSGGSGDVEMFAVYCARCDTDIDWWGAALREDNENVRRAEARLDPDSPPF